ncbi:T9SS type A sorting domain-containing protein [bacterium]|nr:T9SS type A sorting domain-containing protein [bacterium]
MKRFLVIFLTLFLVISICAIDEKVGGKPSWVQSSAVGTSTDLAKSVGIDPAGSTILSYCPAKIEKLVRPGDRTKVAIAELKTRNVIIDLAGCEDEGMPTVPGEIITMMVAKYVLNEATEQYSSYFGVTAIEWDGIYHEEPILAQRANDIIFVEVPKPWATAEKAGAAVVNWNKPELDPFALLYGNPIAGYNLYFSATPKPTPQDMILINDDATIPFDAVSYQDREARTGYYMLTIVGQKDVEFGTYNAGPDKYPGVAFFDDDDNGIEDDFSELGWKDSDDIYIPGHSAVSNLYRDNGAPPKVEGLTLIDSSEKIYLQWSPSPEPSVAYYRIEKNSGSGFIFRGNSQNTIFVDESVKEGDEFIVAAVSPMGVTGEFSNPVVAKPFVGIQDQGNYEAKELLLFPEYSKSGNGYITYYRYDAQKGQHCIFLSDGNGTKTAIVNDIPVYWASSLSWGNDSKIMYFTAIDEKDHTQIYWTEAQFGVLNKYNLLCETKGNWTDPCWTDSLNLDSEKLAMSIDGDIWIMDPTKPPFISGTRNLIALTDFYDPDNNTYGETTMCYQPKWAPDNSAIAFIARYKKSPEGVATTDVWIIKNAPQVISDIFNKIRPPITSIADSRLEFATASLAPNGYAGIWCPSWSNDATMVSYCVDKNNRFANYIFSSNYGAAFEVLSQCNFDAYVFERQIGYWPAGFPAMDDPAKSEGFVTWAPTGGDQFLYTDLDYGKQLISIDQFIDPSIYGQSGKSKMARAVDGLDTIEISDRDLTSITIQKNGFDEFKQVGIYPVTAELATAPFGKRSMGSTRKFVFGGGEEALDDVRVKIHYTRFQAKGSKEYQIAPYQYNEQLKAWTPISNYKIIPDEDGDPMNDEMDGGYVVFETKALGYIGIFCQDDDDDDNDDDPFVENKDMDNVKVGPNPADGSHPVVFSNIPKDTVIKIYSVYGNLIASSTQSRSLSWVSDHWEWVIQNDDFKRIASGIYFATFEYNGETAAKKVAIIR